MIRQLIREHDGDCYIIEIPDDDEIKCDCDRIILREKAFECDVCSNIYCPKCGTPNYKNTGWFICSNCQLDPQLIIDFLLEQLDESNPEK